VTGYLNQSIFFLTDAFPPATSPHPSLIRGE
jgi:hypothetical protein